MGSTLKVRVPVTRTLIDKIKADLKDARGDEGQTDAPEGAQKETEALTARHSLKWLCVPKTLSVLMT